MFIYCNRLGYGRLEVGGWTVNPLAPVIPRQVAGGYIGSEKITNPLTID